MCALDGQIKNLILSTCTEQPWRFSDLSIRLFNIAGKTYNVKCDTKKIMNAK